MGLLSTQDWHAADAIAEIGFVNPFLPARIELERRALGAQFVPYRPFLQYRPEFSVSDMLPNAPKLEKRSAELLEKMRQKLLTHAPASPRELEVYESLAYYCLYARHMSTILDQPAAQFRARPDEGIVDCYAQFAKDYQRFFALPERSLPFRLDCEVVFAGLFQIERAFYHIFQRIVGSSLAAAELRAAIWQSIFTHDMRRYLRSLYRCMRDIPTLITGPSGTGKELVAQAIAHSSFIEFDAKQGEFKANYSDCFVGLNLTAIAPTLIESELFGHAKGAFSGANSQRFGFLDEASCPRWGTVFLDEIGELDTQIQVKLLRVLQTRQFQRVGESATREFAGKIVAATNRDLAVEMQAGRFREDLYYRLCADRIQTPSLRSQLEQSPDDLINIVRYLATRLLPELPGEVEHLTEEVVHWVHRNLGDNYSWPGNIREVEQCVRSILIRGSYVPTQRATADERSRLGRLLEGVERGELNRDELLAGYFAWVYSQAGSYREAGRRLAVDWRTVKAVIEAMERSSP